MSSRKSNLGFHMHELQSIIQVQESPSLTLHCLNALNGDAMKKGHEAGYRIPCSGTWYCLVHRSTWYFRWRRCLHFWDSNGLFYYLLYSLEDIFLYHHLKTDLKLDLYFYSDTATRYHRCHFWRKWRDCRTSHKIKQRQQVRPKFSYSFVIYLCQFNMGWGGVQHRTI